MASNTIDNSPAMRIVVVTADNTNSISNSPIQRIVLVDTTGQPLH